MALLKHEPLLRYNEVLFVPDRISLTFLLIWYNYIKPIDWLDNKKTKKGGVMAENNSTIKDNSEKSPIVEKWASISGYRFSGLNDQEKEQFKKLQSAEEQAKNTQFILGKPIKHSL